MYLVGFTIEIILQMHDPMNVRFILSQSCSSKKYGLPHINCQLIHGFFHSAKAGRVIKKIRCILNGLVSHNNTWVTSSYIISVPEAAYFLLHILIK